MATHTQSANGLLFNRRYTRDDINVFDQFEYDYRTSIIRNPTGEVVFEMNNVEVPKQWSQIATDILAQKYFRKAGLKEVDGEVGETDSRQVFHRLAGCWTDWGKQNGVNVQWQSIPGSPVTARRCTRAGCPARAGSSCSSRIWRILRPRRA